LLFSTLPHAIYCSEDKTARFKRLKKDALRFPYIQVNSKNLKNWLVFDIDHNNPMIWEDVDLPPPNFMVVSKDKKNTSHLFYAIPGVATSSKSRAAPIYYMKAVYEAMALKMKADLSYSGPVAKTPGHPWYRTLEFHNVIYDLGELAEYVELTTKPPWSKGPDLASVSHSRNCRLFETTRFFAYAKVAEARKTSTLSHFEDMLLNYSSARNRFRTDGWTDNLPHSEIKSIVKSIARWSWDHYIGSSVHRGAMNIDNKLPLYTKQKMSAERTAKIKRKKTQVFVRNTVIKLKNLGKNVNASSVSRLSKLSRQTVGKYLDHVLQNLNPIVNLSDILKNAQPVKLGLHQIDTLEHGKKRMLPVALKTTSNLKVCSHEKVFALGTLHESNIGHDTS
jgi:hypothetical protein